ncbi:MAG: hypothetical protein RL684_884 [Pseudomonadota bacterium]
MQPIFATPFASLDTGADPRFNERLAALCAARPERAEFLGTSSGPAGELRAVILGHAGAVVAGLNGYSAARFRDLRVQVQGWCSVVQPDEHIPAQHFPGASWAAVYCVQAGEPAAGFRSAGSLRIFESRLAAAYRDAGNWEMQVPYRYGHYSWSPAPGWMALFPAHVHHEVSVNRSSTPLILVFAVLRYLEADARDNRYA